jgi:GntR family transcriptional regulator
LHILREEGLLDFQRGRGITVAGSPQQGVVVKRVRELIEFCRLQGYRRDEIIRMIESLP